jgi:hypothetical protein
LFAQPMTDTNVASTNVGAGTVDILCRVEGEERLGPAGLATGGKLAIMLGSC